MTNINDGGPAFPFPSGPEPRVNAFHDRWEGMTLRDYFAAHSDQPGMSQIATLLGWRCKGVNGVSHDEPGAFYFDEQWGKLTLQEQALAYSRVRYAIADAMLAAREAGK